MVFDFDIFAFMSREVIDCATNAEASSEGILNLESLQARWSASSMNDSISRSGKP